MATKFKTASIGNFVERVDVWDPRAATQGTEFDYVDIASIDREKKEITAPTRMVASEAPSRARQLIKHRDVLVSTVRPNLNAVAWVPRDLDGATASTGFSVVRCNGSGLHDRYLFHWVRTRQFVGDMVRQSTGASYPAVSDRIVRESKIPLPQPDDPKRSLAEQKRIAAILDKADAIRRRRHEAAQLTDQLIPSLFYDMFGDPVLNPKKWQQSPIAACADVTGGVALSQARAMLDIQVPYLRVANVLRDRLDLSEIKTIGVTREEHDKTRLEANDILVVEGHGNRDEIGRSAIWHGAIPDCIHQNHLIRIRVDEAQVTPEFLNAFINSDAGRRQLFQHGKTTSGLNTISLTNVRETVTLVPPLSLQKQFSHAVREAKAYVARRLETSSHHNDLFNSLVQRAFRGEL